MISLNFIERKWTLVAAVQSLSRPLGTVCGLFALVALAGYFGQIEALYRPIASGPATHPLTALCVLLLGLGLRMNHQTWQGLWTQRLLALVALTIAGARLAEVALGTDFTSWMTPFNNDVLNDHKMGLSNSMGVNTAIMLLCIAGALELYSWRQHTLSQLVSSIAVAIPTVSFTGYAYGLDNFYGQMSLLTATAGFALAFATLATTANHSGLKAILSPYVGGKIARVQAVVGYLVPVALGYIMVKAALSGPGEGQSLFGIFVVTICWFITLMVSFSAIFHEKIDFVRRQAEVKLAEAARTDSLTGLPNRRQFFELGAREIERMNRAGSELWLLMLDLDHFKRINDTAGHATGDQVLIAVAKALLQAIRKVDVVGRIGGEEFAVLVTDINRGGCERVAESIRHAVEGLRVIGWTDLHGPVTVSIGCAPLPLKGTLEATLAKADEALYRAKEDGRNRVAFYVPPSGRFE